MTSYDRFDRDLAVWIDGETSVTAPAGLHAGAIERARRTRQRPGLLVALRGGTIGRPTVGGLDRRALLVLAATALALGAALALIGSGALRQDRARPLAVNGAIAYMTGDDTKREWQLFVACADLTKARPIALTPGRSSGWPAWSPRGDRLAFNANFDDPDMTDELEIWDIDTSDPDGSNLLKLTQSAGLEGDPAYSADGTLITFDSTEPGKKGVWVMNAKDGSGQHLVTPTPDGQVIDYAPSFSPDGTQIVFTRQTSDSTAVLYVVNIDGSGLTEITPTNLQPLKAAWSPDGSTIVFDVASYLLPDRGIFTVRPDGTDLRNLDLPTGSDAVADGYSDPVWSPDGSLILLVHGLHQGSDLLRIGLATMRPDGTGLQWLSEDPVAKNKPVWGTAAC